MTQYLFLLVEGFVQRNRLASGLKSIEMIHTYM